MEPHESRVTAQKGIRLRLLEGGYTPLPLTNKMCLLKGWNDVTPTPELIDKWARMKASQTTGIRVDGRLIALDFDIDDRDVMDRVLDLAYEINPAFDTLPTRFGGGTAKQMWFARLREEDPVWVRWRSKTCVAPGFDPKDEFAPRHVLELFSSGSTREVGVYGVHTPGEDYQAPPARSYRWDDGAADLLNTPLNLLPEVSRDDITRLVDAVHQAFEEQGFRQVSVVPHGVGSRDSVYDLGPATVFRCADGETRTYLELRDYASSSRSPRCDASFTDPASVNTERCVVGIDHKDRVYVVDFMTETRHYAAGDRERALGELGEEIIQRALAEGLVTQEELDSVGGERLDSFTSALANCHASYAVDPSGNGGAGRFLRIDGRRDRELSTAGLRLKYLPFGITLTGPKGGRGKRINPADVFATDPLRPVANGYRFLPDDHPGIVVKEEGSFINTCPPIRHDLTQEWPQLQQLFLDFMRHLIPDDVEREWLLDRIAHKAQHLSIPGVTPLIVTPTLGTGRNTLFEMLRETFGGRHLVTTDLMAAKLLGTAGQSQYNDWVLDKHWICCGEVLASDEANTPRGRKRVLEHMKQLLDPAPGKEMTLTVKYERGSQQVVTASFMLASNHISALPIEAGDRRFAVLTGTDTPLVANADLYARLAKQRPGGHYNPGFGAAIWKLLQERDVAAFDPTQAPVFAGAMAMEASNRTELDDLVGDVLDSNPFGWGSLQDLTSVVQRKIARSEFGVDTPSNYTRTAIRDRIRDRWAAEHPSRVRLPGNELVTLVARDKATLADALALSPEDRKTRAKWTPDSAVAPTIRIVK